MKALLLTLLCALALPVWAQETVYIRDELYVPLRSGQSLQHRIVHRGLVSGTPMTLLESNSDTGYSRVRTDKGVEGWIQTQYLTDEPVAAQKLQQATAELTQLRKRTAELNRQLEAARSARTETSQEAEQLAEQNAALQQELAQIREVSANAIKLDQDNKALLEQVEVLKHRVDVLETDNRRLQNNQENEAFLNGAFAVLIGVMVTLIVPRLWPKKRSEWA